MCGLVGVFGLNLQRKHYDYFTQGLEVDALRGRQSTGVMMMGGKWHGEVYKKADHGVDVVYDMSLMSLHKEFLTGYGALGHNRAATRGSVKEENAHPFTHGHITLAHNGTLSNYFKLPGYGKYEVDSEVLTHAVCVLGIQKTLELIEGAYALTWWDEKALRLYMIRNNTRSLYIAKEKNSSKHLWGSEAGMIKWLCDRNRIEIDEPVLLSPDTLWSVGVEFKESGYLKTYEIRKEEIKLSIKKPTVGSKQQGKKKRGTSLTVVKSSYSQQKNTKITKATSKGTDFKDPDLYRGQRVAVIATSFSFYNGSSRGLGYWEVSYTDGVKSYTLECHDSTPSEMSTGEWYTVGIVGVLEKQWSGCGTLVYVSRPVKIGDTIVNEEESEIPFELVEDDQEDVVEKTRDIIDQIKEDDKRPSYVDIEGLTYVWHGWNRDYVPEVSFNRATSHGCSNCSGDIHIDDATELSWASSQSPICYGCKDIVEKEFNIELF